VYFRFNTNSLTIENTIKFDIDKGSSVKRGLMAPFHAHN
jgi:hypothetical protein